jgi:hypothetical protein
MPASHPMHLQTLEWKALSREDKAELLGRLKTNSTAALSSSAASPLNAVAQSVSPTSHRSQAGPASPTTDADLMYADHRKALQTIAKGNKQKLKELKQRDKEIDKEANLLLNRMAAVHGFDVPKERTAGDEISSFYDAFHSRLASIYDEPPEGTTFYHVVKLIMHGAGDCVTPDRDAAVVVERDVMAYARRLLQTLRALTGKEKLRLADFSTQMPEATSVYFRWKVLKGMANDGDSSDKTPAAPAAFASADSDSDLSDVDVSDELDLPVEESQASAVTPVDESVDTTAIPDDLEEQAYRPYEDAGSFVVSSTPRKTGTQFLPILPSPDEINSSIRALLQVPSLRMTRRRRCRRLSLQRGPLRIFWLRLPLLHLL